jgi:hypothetical protein
MKLFRQIKNTPMEFKVAAAVVVFILLSPTITQSSLSGYSSITAEWHKVRWPNAQMSGKYFEMPLSGSTFTWNPDNIDADSGGRISDGLSDLPKINGEVENPKFDRNIEYRHWWLNDTVSAAYPEGNARHFEWSIDVYTMDVEFYAFEGTTYIQPVAEVWVELKNNANSVFVNFGAEEAASYIIYAQTEDYTWVPADAGWHLVTPSSGNFELLFLSGNRVYPPTPQEGSNLNFDNLEKYSHIALPFEFTQLGSASYGSAPRIQMIVELNVLTVGRMDYVLTYVAGGENEIGPVGELGVWATMGAALEAGLSGLGDMLVGAVLPIVVVIGVALVFALVIWGLIKSRRNQ